MLTGSLIRGDEGTVLDRMRGVLMRRIRTYAKASRVHRNSRDDGSH